MPPMRRLPLLCPSVLDGVLMTGPCGGSTCSWWQHGEGCSAHRQTEEMLGAWVGYATGTIPDCSITAQCRWHHQALRAGHAACFPRRTGNVCEHQGGDFNAFDYAYGLEESQGGA